MTDTDWAPTTAPTRTVTVRAHYEDGTWWGESADVPGWTAGDADWDEFFRLCVDGVRFTLEDEEVNVVVIKP